MLPYQGVLTLDATTNHTELNNCSSPFCSLVHCASIFTPLSCYIAGTMPKKSRLKEEYKPTKMFYGAKQNSESDSSFAPEDDGQEASEVGEALEDNGHEGPEDDTNRSPAVCCKLGY